MDECISLQTCEDNDDDDDDEEEGLLHFGSWGMEGRTDGRIRIRTRAF